MTDQTIIPFKVEHLENINFRKIDADIFQMYGNEPELFKECEKGSAITYVRDNEIIGCGGVFPLWKNVGQCWMIACCDYKKYWLNAGRYMLWTINAAFKTFDLNRIQGTARANHKEAIKFLKWANFKEEGTLKSYGANGEDHIMFARLNNVI